VVEGIVCSIRDIAAGKLVGKTKGPAEGYVFEVLQDRTFSPALSSTRNIGGARPPAEVTSNPTWRKVREVLREAAARGQLLGGAPQELLGSVLDGWRVTKVRAQMVERRE